MDTLKKSRSGMGQAWVRQGGDYKVHEHNYNSQPFNNVAQGATFCLPAIYK